MHQTTLERIEQELKKIKRQLQCGTQFFDTVEEFPAVGVPCAIYVDKSTGAFYVYDTETATYITADAGEDVDFSLTTTGTSGPATLVGTILNIPQYQGVLTNPVTGTGITGQIAYFSGTSAVTGSANLFWDNTNGRLGIGTATPSLALQVERSSNGSESIWIRNTNTGASAFGALVAASYGVSPSTSGTVELRSHNFNHGAWPSTGMLVSNSSLTNGLAIFSAAGNITFNTTSGGTERARIESGGNFVIGTTSASARLHVRGSGTTSATTALLVQNNDATPARLMSVRDDGRIYIGSQSDTQAPFLAGYTSTTPHGASQRALGLVWNGGAGTRPNPAMLFTASSDINWTSGVGDMFQTLINYNPSSGTGVLNTFLIQTTINQTGGANGITRGLYVSPILTAAADWRGVEIATSTVNTVVLGKNTGSAAVEVTSTTQGFLPPRMTTAQRNLIASPAAGLVIFNTTTTKLECYDGAAWQAAW